MERLQVQLIVSLYRNAACRGALHSFRDRVGIPEVILVALPKRLRKSRRYLFDHVTDKSVMMSSLIPSEKYSYSGSPDMLMNGKTAIDAAATFGSGLATDREMAEVVALGCHFHTRIGRSMFLTLISPPSWKRTSIRLPTLSLTIDETQIPPGSASGSKRAATLTPSP